MNRRTRRGMGVLMALLLVLAAGAGRPPGDQTDAQDGVAVSRPDPPPERPNIVFLMTDDLDAGDLSRFPNITNLLVRKGTTFDRFFVSNSWCCPSRSTILRSQYVHTHHIFTNVAPHGGFGKFYRRGLDKSTVATWLQGSGYRTALIGKYLNHYPAGAKRTYIPPGWDEWVAALRGGMYNEYNYRLNENGKVKRYGKKSRDYLTDVLSRRAADFVTRAAAPVSGEQPGTVTASSDGGRRPFFLMLTPTAPHQPANYARRYARYYKKVKAPRTRSYNQKNLSEEPNWLRDRPVLSSSQIRQIDSLYRRRLRSMRGVDDMVGKLVKTLEKNGQLNNTYFFFSSDNGFHLGQRRLPMGKTTPFEEDIRVPFIVRGPRVREGGRTGSLGATVDLGPTFAELAGARTPGFAEGRSMAPLLRGETPDERRKNVLVEFFNMEKKGVSTGGLGTPRPPTYAVLRTDRYSYVEYVTGERQLYDMRKDPEQLHNLAPSAPNHLLRDLHKRLRDLRECRAAACRDADSQ